MKILHLKSIDSTHLYALRLIDASMAYLDTSDILTIFADEQTSGIGRCNRYWVSQKGNLFTSVIMPMPPNSDLGQLSLAVACSVRETISAVLRRCLKDPRIMDDLLQKLKLHWPNDVYYDSAKISGLLLAVSNGMLVISVGININSSPDFSDYPTINLKKILQNVCDCDIGSKLPCFSRRSCVFFDGLEGDWCRGHQSQTQKWRQNRDKSKSLDRDRGLCCPPIFLQELGCRGVLDMLLSNLISWISNLCSLGFSEVRSYWLRNIKEINCNVAVKNGNSILKGIFLGISDSGKAVLKQNDRMLLVSSGDLFVSERG